MSGKSERKMVSACYDHLGGRLGESLYKFLVDETWIRKVGGEREYGITEKGWRELEGFGIDVEKLRTTKRKMVVPCVERHRGVFYPHTGAYLGGLLEERLFELGWLARKEDKVLEITEKGFKGLNSMGIEMGVQPLSEGARD